MTVHYSERPFLQLFSSGITTGGLAAMIANGLIRIKE